MTARDSPLSGRVALITGAGRGLGASHAAVLAAAGAAVVVNDPSLSIDGSRSENSDVAQVVADSIVATGGTAIADRSDISSFDGATKAVNRAFEAFGRIDIVVNNAGILSTTGIAELSQDELERSLATHVTGAIGTARAAFPLMRAQRYGRIVNTVSEAALAIGHHSGTAYAASKAALWGVTMALADEGAPDGITVNAISPGARTRMSAAHLERTSSALDLDPAHVSSVLLALVSESAADITGRIVHAAAGAVREYLLRRHSETEILARLANPPVLNNERNLREYG